MSRPGGDPAVPDRQARGHRGMPAGLLEKLMAAVRPEFRADDLVFDPRDPVFGGPPAWWAAAPARTASEACACRIGSGGGHRARRTWLSSPRRPLRAGTGTCPWAHA